MKRRFILLILSVILCLSMSGYSFAASETTVDLNEISASDWMEYLPDNAPLLEVNLPGTHNAACRYFYDVPFKYGGITISTGLINYYGKTQDLSIPEQMEAGVRIFDCRIALAESVDRNHLVVPHNMLITADKKDNGSIMTVETVVAHVEEFLKEHPTETVVIAAEKDGRTYDTSSSRFKELEKQLYDSFRNNPDRVIIEAEDPSPRMKDVRGKAVIIDGGLMVGFSGDSAKKAEDKWKGLKPLMDSAIEQNYEEDAYVTILDDTKLIRPRTLNTSSRGEITDDGKTIGLGIPYPETNAKVMNEYLLNYNYQYGKLYGWFLMDFVTEDLNKRIFLSNNFDSNVIREKHTMTYIEATAETCETSGNSEYWQCSDCDRYFSDVYGMNEIEEGSWIIPPKGHSMEYHKASGATCTETGNIEYWQCSDCDRYFSDVYGMNEIEEGSWIIPAKGHEYKYCEHAAGLMKNGESYYECKACGNIKDRKVLKGVSKSYVKGFRLSKGRKSITVKWKKQSKKKLKEFSGYQIRYSTDANMTGAKYRNIGKSGKSVKLRKLKSKKKYYVEIRTYTKTGNDTFYSDWTRKAAVTK